MESRWYSSWYISMNIPPRKEGHYAYYWRVDGKVCLLIGVRSLPPLSSCKNLPPSTWHALGMFKFTIVFAGALQWVKSMVGKMWGWIWLFSHPRPLILRGPPPLGITLHVRKISNLYFIFENASLDNQGTLHFCKIPKFEIFLYLGEGKPHFWHFLDS
jgi:hypothetical protein